MQLTQQGSNTSKGYTPPTPPFPFPWPCDTMWRRYASHSSIHVGEYIKYAAAEAGEAVIPAEVTRLPNLFHSSCLTNPSSENNGILQGPWYSQLMSMLVAAAYLLSKSTFAGKSKSTPSSLRRRSRTGTISSTVKWIASSGYHFCSLASRNDLARNSLNRISSGNGSL